MAANFLEFWIAVLGDTGGVSEQSMDQIQAEMERIYNLATAATPNAYAASIIAGLEQRAASGQRLNFGASPSLSWGSVESQNKINVGQFPDGHLAVVRAFNVLGVWTEEPIYKTLAHELAHLVLGKEDPPGATGSSVVERVLAANATADLRGGAEEVANSIAQSLLDIAHLTPSYFLADVGNKQLELFSPALLYTYGNPITNGFAIASVAGTAAENADNYEIDRRGFLTFDNDLLIGGRGADLIYGGFGDDYIHGNQGSDTIVPGQGFDIVHGGLLGSLLGSSDFDVVSYNLVHNPSPFGVVVDFTAQIPQALQAQFEIANYFNKPIIVVTNDGFLNRDYLIDIEVVRMDTPFVDELKLTRSAVQRYVEMDYGLVVDSSWFVGDKFIYSGFSLAEGALYIKYIPMLYEPILFPNAGAEKGRIVIFIEPRTQVVPESVRETITGSAGGDLFGIGSFEEEGVSTTPGASMLVLGDGDKDKMQFEHVSGGGVLLTASAIRYAGADWLPDFFSSVHGDFALQGMEWVELTEFADRITLASFHATSERVVVNGGNAEASGGTGSPVDAGDRIDFSSYESAVYLDYARTNIVTDFIGLTSAPYAVELYTDYSPGLALGQWVMNLFVTSSEVPGQGAYNGTGIRFTNFEHVIGSTHDDVMSLWRLSPGGELSAEQEAAFKAAQELPVSLASGDPAVIGAAFDARVTAAAEIAQNQQEVVIEGGAGDDLIVGSRTGANRIHGGDGVDKLYAGGFTSELYGDAGTDFLQGGGLKSQLYGGAGADLFGLASHTFVMDATSEDFITWGPFHLTGGVAQWWTEGDWAYWTPFTSLISGAPLSFLNVFGALAVILDAAAASAFRYTVTSGGQLVVQAGLGRLAQAVVENYQLDLDSGEATGHVVAFKQVMGEGSLADYERYLSLALKAGFGVGISGTDPLVLDLDGDGLELTRRDAGNVYFNLDNDDFAEKTAWVRGDDGFLARDLNGNGLIDGIAELFGNETTSGFSALAALDSSGDGKISAADAAFDTLRIWRDLDGDGVTDPGELETLAETGITEISLASATPAQGAVLGNSIRAEATFTRADGTTSKIADVLLESNQTDSRYLGDSNVSSIAAALPNLKGFGNVTDLQVAMTNDAGFTTSSRYAKDSHSVAWARAIRVHRDPLKTGESIRIIATQTSCFDRFPASQRGILLSEASCGPDGVLELKVIPETIADRRHRAEHTQ